VVAAFIHTVAASKLLSLVTQLTPSGSGWTETDLVDFGGGKNDGQFPYGSVVLDASGNIYGTTLEGGSQGRGNVWEITP
jgi:hypothetical protein